MTAPRNTKAAGAAGPKLGFVQVDDIQIPVSFHGDLSPVDVVGDFLRQLAELHANWSDDELIEIAQQLDGGDGP